MFASLIHDDLFVSVLVSLHDVYHDKCEVF